MTRTLVTGVAGFTGRYLAHALAERGHEVHGLVHQHEPELAEIVSPHEADLADLDALKKVVAEVQPDHVVHLAAIANVAHGDIEQMFQTNVVGTRQLLEALAQSPATPSSVLIASSVWDFWNARRAMASAR